MTTADLRFLGAATALLIVAVSCAPSDSPVAGGEDDPTFERIGEDSFLNTEPLATPADLVAPAGDDEPWHIVGSIFDPQNGRSQAAVWQSEDGRGWERNDLDSTQSGNSEEMRAVTRTDDGLLATGSAGLGEESDAVLWRSSGEPGAEWSQIAPAEMVSNHEVWGFDVAVGDGGIVVAGGERAWGDVRPRMWHSSNGEDWQVVDGGDDGPFQESGQESVTDVTAFGEGFVAVGWERIDGEQNGLAWYSPDGVSWERLDAPELGGDSRQALLSVAAVDGAVVAGGYAADETGQGQPVVWRSDDGQSWSEPSGPLPLEESRRSTASDMSVQSLQLAEPGDDAEEGDVTLMASGGTRARPHVWRSIDGGETWVALPSPRTATFPDGIDFTVAGRAGDSTIAVGSEPLVVNLDGEDWRPAAGDAFPDGGAKPVGTSVVLDGDTTLIGGYELTNWYDSKPQQHYEARVWRREGDGSFDTIEPEEEGEAEGEEAEGEGEADEDGESVLQEFSVGAIEAMTAYGGGYIAVGQENFSIARERSAGDPSPDGLLWRSDDGVTWRRFAWEIATVDPEQLAELFTGALDDYSVEEIVNAFGAAAISEPRSTQLPAGGPGTRSLQGVAPMGEDGFIAVGSAFTDNTISPIVARSTEEGVESEDAGLSGEGSQRFNDVCRAPGAIIAVGTTGSDGRYNAAVSYRDGEGWQEAVASDDSFDSPGSQQALACASSDDGFVVVGSDDSGGSLNAKIWTSDDGTEWQEVTAGILGGSGEQEATAVAAIPGGGWLVAGSDTASDDAGIALWHLRPDGSLERRDQGEPSLSSALPMSVHDIAITSDRVVIVGSDSNGLGFWETDTSDLDRG